jgi:hypothetical protein
MSYTPINITVYDLAFIGAAMGMMSSERAEISAVSSRFDAASARCQAWAQSFDVAWGSATALDEVQALGISYGSFGVWQKAVAQNDTPSLSPSQYTPLITGIIAEITSIEANFTLEGVTPNAWGGGGGGGGVPTPPAAGLLLTSTGSGSGDYDWEPSGGFAILTFTSFTNTIEVGNSVVDPTLHATYNETPDSAQIIYTGPPGSPLVLTTPFTSGQILETFTEATNAATNTATLSAVKGATTKTNTQTLTWGLPFLFNIDTVSNVVATQAYLDTMRAAHAPQIHTTLTGTYGTGLSVGAGQIFAFACETALGTPIVHDINGFLVTPVLVGTVAGYTNPFSVGIPMSLYTFGAIDIGSVSFSVT